MDPDRLRARRPQPVRVVEGRRRPNARREGDRPAGLPAARRPVRDRRRVRPAATRPGRCGSAAATPSAELVRERRRARSTSRHDGVHLRARHRSGPGAHPTQGRRVPAPPSRRGDRRRRLRDRGRRGPHRRARHAGRARRPADPARRPTTRCGASSSSPSTSPPTPTPAVASPSSGGPARRSSTTSPSSRSSTATVDQRPPLGPGVVRAAAPVGRPPGGPARRRDLPGVP